MAKQYRTYLDSPSAGFLRTVVILSVIQACLSSFTFLSNVAGALFLDNFDNPVNALIFSLIPLIEAIAMFILIVFFRSDRVRSQTKMFAYPVVLYSLSNLLYFIYALMNWKWNNLVYAVTVILLALVAADCYYGFKRIVASIFALILAGVCQLANIFYDLINLIIASPGYVGWGETAFSLIVSLFSAIPYLIMILYLRERIAIGKRLENQALCSRSR